MSAIVTIIDSPLGLTQYVVAWIADSNGSVDVQFDGRRNQHILGLIDQLKTVPSAGVAPTDNYDITLVDRLGLDALDGEGINRDTADPETAWPNATLGTTHTLDVGTLGDLELRIRNASNGGAGLAVIQVLPGDVAASA